MSMKQMLSGFRWFITDSLKIETHLTASSRGQKCLSFLLFGTPVANQCLR